MYICDGLGLSATNAGSRVAEDENKLCIYTAIIGIIWLTV